MNFKVLTVVGTRPEIIKLSRVIAELDAFTDHVLVHTEQNFDYELDEIFFSEMGVRAPNYRLGTAGKTAAETIGRVITKTDEVFEKERPDAVLILGDTNSALSAIAAKRRKIPIFHMEAGNRCFDQRVPEEVNRRIVDHVSDINLPYTEHARRYLLREGLRPETVIKTGSPMGEVLEYYRQPIAESQAVEELGLEKGSFFLVSAHREENVDSQENFKNLLASLDRIVETWDLPVIVSTHPRTRQRLEAMGDSVPLGSKIRFLKPLGFFDYAHLQQQARCVISDSGTITEEASILGFPAVTIRQAHERPEGMDEGTLIMCGLQPDRVVEAVRAVIAQAAGEPGFRVVDDYRPKNVSKKVLRVILSYTEYVNRTVWHRSRQPSR